VFGTGVGTYAAAIPPYRTDLDETRAEHAESDLMEHASETGLIGVIVLAGFVIVVARRALTRIAKGDGIGRNQGVLMGAIAAAFALLVHSIFDFNTRIPSNALLLAVLLGVVASAHPREHRRLPLRLTLRLSPAVIVLILLMTFAWRSATIGLSRHATREVDPFMAKPEEFGRVAARLAEAEASAASNPEVTFKRGVLYNEEAYRSADAERYRDIRFGQAQSSFEQAVRLAPARGRHWFELAWIQGNLRTDSIADSLFRYSIHLEPTWSRLRANYALYLASRNKIEDALKNLELARGLTPGISSYEAVTIIAPYVNDDPAILQQAAGDDSASDDAVSRYLSERRTGKP
jgi:hypothetical protein